jgi:hypothetical protein
MPSKSFSYTVPHFPNHFTLLIPMISKMIVCHFRHADDTDSVLHFGKSLHASSMADTISGCL